MRNTTFKIIAALLLSASVAGAAQYWVATNGNNSNPGTQALPWLTIAHAASVAQTNDVVRVTSGNYYENVTPAHSGSQGTNIIYLGIGQPVTYSFNMAQLNNWAIIGFHFVATNYTDPISINRSTNFQILDCWFDNVNPKHGAIFTANSTGYWPIYCGPGLIRSNYINEPLEFPGGPSGTNLFPGEALLLYGATNCLIEYNIVRAAYNFSHFSGMSNVFRNNLFYDVETNYWITSIITNAPHVDTFEIQCGTGVTSNSFRNVLERNMTISNDLPNSKFIIAQNQYTNTSIESISDFIIRQNVVQSLGSYVFLFDDVYNMRTYNNTFINTLWQSIAAYGHKSYYCIEGSTNYGGTGTILPTNMVVINSIFDAVDDPGFGTIFISGLPTISSNAPYYDMFANNVTYQSGSSINQTSGGDITNTDPQFVSIANLDAHVSSTSPGIARSRPQTTTTAGGSSTAIVPVADAGFFTDGWGIQWVNGDVVEVGTNSGVMIASVNYAANTLTLASPITFNNGDGVFLDGTQDIGAYKYDANGYSYGITLTAPLNFAITSGTTTLTATVTNPNKVRIVRFYVDGLEVGNAPPAPVVSINAVISGANNVVQARAYALYADTNLAMASSVTVNPIPLLPPTGLRVVSP